MRLYPIPIKYGPYEGSERDLPRSGQQMRGDQGVGEGKKREYRRLGGSHFAIVKMKVDPQ
jgi:hypothetical protein